MNEDVASATGNPSSVSKRACKESFSVVHTSVCNVSSASSKFKKSIT